MLYFQYFLNNEAEKFIIFQENSKIIGSSNNQGLESDGIPGGSRSRRAQQLVPPLPRVPLPSLKQETTHPEFRKFKIDWAVYKKVTQLPDAQIAPQLYIIIFI